MTDERKATAILVGDLHLTDRQPICRTDNFWDTQCTKGEWLKDLQRHHGGCPIIQVGDVFDHWKASPQCIAMALNHYPPMITIPGNHDLPAHSMAEYRKSALHVLESAGWRVLTWGEYNTANFCIHPLPWGLTQDAPISLLMHRRHILLAHLMVLDGPAAFEGVSASDMSFAYPGYDLILTGHNHSPILCVTVPGRTLLNPGSFTRQTASENHEPAVWLWYADTNKVARIVVPHDPAAVTRQHIDAKKERDSKIAEYVDKIKGAGDVELSMEADAVLDGVGDGAHSIKRISFSANVRKVAAEADAEPPIIARIEWALDTEVK